MYQNTKKTGSALSGGGYRVARTDPKALNAIHEQLLQQRRARMSPQPAAAPSPASNMSAAAQTLTDRRAAILARIKSKSETAAVEAKTALPSRFDLTDSAASINQRRAAILARLRKKQESAVAEAPAPAPTPAPTPVSEVLVPEVPVAEFFIPAVPLPEVRIQEAAASETPISEAAAAPAIVIVPVEMAAAPSVAVETPSTGEMAAKIDEIEKVCRSLARGPPRHKFPLEVKAKLAKAHVLRDAAITAIMNGQNEEVAELNQSLLTVLDELSRMIHYRYKFNQYRPAPSCDPEHEEEVRSFALFPNLTSARSDAATRLACLYYGFSEKMKDLEYNNAKPPPFIGYFLLMDRLMKSEVFSATEAARLILTGAVSLPSDMQAAIVPAPALPQAISVPRRAWRGVTASISKLWQRARHWPLSVAERFVSWRLEKSFDRFENELQNPANDAERLRSALRSYHRAAFWLCALNKGLPLSKLQLNVLAPNLSDEEIAAAGHLASAYNGINGKTKEDGCCEMTHDMRAMGYLVFYGMSVEDAAAVMIRRRTVSSMLRELRPQEQALVSQVVGGSGTCSEADLKKFLALPPAVRELRLRSIGNTLWVKTDWWATFSKSLEESATQVPLGVGAEMDNFRKVSDRLHVICRLQQPNGADRLKAISSPRMLSPMQREMVASLLGTSSRSLTAEHMEEFRTRMLSLEPEERRYQWKQTVNDLFALADLAYRMRFAPSAYSKEDAVMISLALGKAVNEINVEDMDLFTKMLVEKSHNGVDGYHELLVRLRTSMTLSPKSLAIAAFREAEFLTVLDFLGVPVEKATGRIGYESGVTKQGPDKNPEGMPRNNEDAFSSAIVLLSNRTEVRLRALWDGMGGHSSGRLASGIARYVFEVAATAGWVRTAEDVRRYHMILADLAITMEGIRLVSEHGQDGNNLGTTAVVAVLRDGNCQFVHCGDSTGRIIRSDAEIFRTNPHVLANDPPLLDHHLSLLISNGSTPEGALKSIKKAKGMVVSALGVRPKKIDISPTTIVQKGDVVLLNSDGFDPICHHDVHGVLMDTHGDCDLARSVLMQLAASKRAIVRELKKNAAKDAKPAHLCGCPLAKSREDDTTCVMEIIQSL